MEQKSTVYIRVVYGKIARSLCL